MNSQRDSISDDMKENQDQEKVQQNEIGINKLPLKSQGSKFLSHIDSTSLQQQSSHVNYQQQQKQGLLNQHQQIIEKYQNQEQKLDDIKLEIQEDEEEEEQKCQNKNFQNQNFHQIFNKNINKKAIDEYENELKKNNILKEEKLYFNLNKIVKNINQKPGYQIPQTHIGKLNLNTQPHEEIKLKNALYEIKSFLIQNTHVYNFYEVYERDVQLNPNKQNKYDKWQNQYIDEYLQFPQFYEEINSKKIEQMQQFMQKEIIPLQSLTKEMLKSIAQDRKFDIKSQKYPYPYTWKLSQWLQKGSLSRIRAFYHDYSMTYRNLYYIKNRFYQKKKKNSYKNAFLFPQIYHALINIFLFPLSIFGLIFGLPGRKKPIYNIDKEKYQTYQMKISDFLQKKLTDEEKKNFVALYELLLPIQNNNQSFYNNILGNKSYNYLISVCQNIEKDLKNQEKYCFREYDKTDPKYYKNIQKEVYLDYQCELFMKQDIKELNNEKKQLICNALKAKYIIDYIQQQEESNFQNVSKKQIQEQIKKKHPIRSRFKKWWHKATNKLYKEERQKSIEVARKKIENELTEHKLDVYKSFIQIYTEHKDFRNKELERDFKKKNKEPIRIRKVRRKLIFPKVEKISNNKYRYQKYTYINIATVFPFWRIAMIFIRWYVWGSNTFLWLMKQSFIGQLSLKALFTCKKYYRHKYFDPKTGIVSPATKRTAIRPVCYIFGNVIKGIKRSRNKFENAPDTGLFPKNFGRICNLIECYIFRFLFVGIFLTLLGMPILIFLNFVFSFILGLLAIVYMPFVILVVHMIQWLIYDFDNLKDKDWKPLRQRSILPLFTYAFDLFMIIFEFVWAILLLIIHIFLSVFFIFFGIIRYILRGIYDCFCLQCIKCNGRTPSSDTCLAWQIKGPGIGIHKYKQISQDDIMILFKGFLLKTVLEIFQKQIKTQIEYHYSENNSKIQTVFQKLGGTYNNKNDDKEHFLKFLEDQIRFRFTKVYKNTLHGQVRLSKQNLDYGMNQTKLILQDYLNQYECLQDMWTQYNIKLNNFDELNTAIWIQIFGNNITEPFEDVEARMEVKYSDSNAAAHIENAFKGRTNLTNNQQRFKYQERKEVQYEFYMNQPPLFSQLLMDIKDKDKSQNQKYYGYTYNEIDSKIVTDYIQFYLETKGIENLEIL